MVGKSDFNENPVVRPDWDFGHRLRVCQYISLVKFLISTRKLLVFFLDIHIFCAGDFFISLVAILYIAVRRNKVLCR